MGNKVCMKSIKIRMTLLACHNIIIINGMLWLALECT